MHKAEIASTAKHYGVQSVPAVVIDGKLRLAVLDVGPMRMFCVQRWPD